MPRIKPVSTDEFDLRDIDLTPKGAAAIRRLRRPQATDKSVAIRRRFRRYGTNTKGATRRKLKALGLVSKR
ncbi:MAG: hypothetical protein ACREH5_05510 [Candidatus Omnitrophota bacterium]